MGCSYTHYANYPPVHMPDRPLLSVVIPTLDEETTVGALLSDIAALTIPMEVIVVDGGSTDSTLDICRAAEVTIVQSATGRGVQLQAGADAARASLLFFVHADARLDRAAVALLDEIAVARPPCAMAFRLRIDARGLGFRLIEWGANVRSRLLRLPYGDQGLLVRREDYVRAGGYPAVPVFEDVALVRALDRITSVHLLDAAIDVSPRRWRVDGALRRTLSNWLLLARYLAGASPERLVGRYRPGGSSHG